MYLVVRPLAVAAVGFANDPYREKHALSGVACSLPKREESTRDKINAVTLFTTR